MQASTNVAAGLQRFYERFSSQDPDAFAASLSTGPGVSVIGSGPGEGHDNRDDWVSTYRSFITEVGIRLEGGANPRGWEEDNVGFALDEPRFVLPDGTFLPTRLTGVLRREGGEWKVVHLHFSVGVPDEEAIQQPN